MIAFILSQMIGVVLAWDKSPDSSVVGYKIYAMKEPATDYTLAVTVGDVDTATVNTRPYQNAKFVATAMDANGLESDFSNECIYSTPASKLSITKTMNGPSTVITLKAPVFNGMVYRIEGSSDLQTWNTVSSGTATSNNLSVPFNPAVPVAFYRLVKISAPSPSRMMALTESVGVPPLTLTPPTAWEMRRWKIGTLDTRKGAERLMFKPKLKIKPPIPPRIK